RAVHLDDAPTRQAADAERHVERDRPRRDDLHGCPGPVPQPHDRSLAEVAIDLGEGRFEGLLAVFRSWHGFHLLLWAPCAATDGSSGTLPGTSGTTVRGPTDTSAFSGPACRQG